VVFDINILNDYIEKGLVVKNDHPTLPLSIYNYSRTTQYEGKWDNITKSCRGLILDREGNVVAKSFDKFFNLEEHNPEEIPNEEFEVYEKLDGSLGILFWYQGKWILASKGSFISDQAIKGKNILNSKYNVEPIPKGYTTLVEIIYPENRIVCSYGNDEVLVVLSMVSNASGKELDYDSLLKINEETGLPVIKKYDGIQDYKTLKTLISKDREGYVVRFRNGFRIKIKGDEYVRLHRILTGFSNVDIWEYLKDKKDLNELLDKVPDEFDAWVRNTVNELNSQFEGIEKEYQWIFKVTKRVEGIEDRKIFAEYAMRYKNPSILFSMLDNKNYDEIIWKLIRPQYSKPFWQKEDES
jgi:T4 RnlA family RNA ligase